MTSIVFEAVIPDKMFELKQKNQAILEKADNFDISFRMVYD